MTGLDELLRLIETTRQTETVYPREGDDDFEPYDQLVITAHVEIDGVEYTQVSTLAPNAYPEVVNSVESLTREHLARQVIEARR